MKLRKPCPEHNRYEEHPVYDGRVRIAVCPGGVFLPDDTLVIEKNELGLWPKWAKNAIHDWFTEVQRAKSQRPSMRSTAVEQHPASALLDALSVREAE